MSELTTSMRKITTIFLMIALMIYPLAGIVTEVNYAEDVVTVQDGAGNLWQFLDAEDWGVGDLCALLMDDNGTEDIRDDSILLVRYGGRAQWAY